MATTAQIKSADRVEQLGDALAGRIAAQLAIAKAKRTAPPGWDEVIERRESRRLEAMEDAIAERALEDEDDDRDD